MNPDRPTSPCQAETPTTTWEDDDTSSALADPLPDWKDDDTPSALADPLPVWEDVDVPSAFSAPRPVGWRDCDDAPRAIEILDADDTEGS